MLESFEISNFRLFQRLQVKRLNRVNLIVGKNNAGKSTFLEALQLYISNADPYILLNLVETRRETWLSEAQSESQTFTGNAVRHLFFGHKLPQIGEEGILIGEMSSQKLQISVAAYQHEGNDEGTIKKTRISSFDLDSFDENFSNIELFLLVEKGEKIRRLLHLDRFLSDVRGYRPRVFHERQEAEYKSTWQIVKTDNMPNQKLDALWSLISVIPLGSEVIAALKLIDDRVSGITFVADISRGRSGDNRIPMVKLEGIDELLPLKSMGDGMTRLFHLIVALVNAQNGVLLIDEFENGLHWTVQPKVWDIVFQVSEKLNVQVFATTHSRDCIEGFETAWKQYSNLGNFFRLDVKQGMIKVTEYTSETLSDALEMDVEVR